MVAAKAQKNILSNKNIFVCPAQIGDLVDGYVQAVQPYGAFISIGKETDALGLLGISQVSHGSFLDINDVLEVGDTVKVRCEYFERDCTTCTFAVWC